MAGPRGRHYRAYDSRNGLRNRRDDLGPRRSRPVPLRPRRLALSVAGTLRVPSAWSLPLSKSVVVVGGGVVGLCSAYYLSARGFHVTVLDRDPAEREGCSFGNS